MSGLETLPPDQRAVLQLILVQGRGYAELAGLLKIDPGAVRTRAHAGLDALVAATAEQPDAERRARIADYLLGQQDEGERLVTLVELGDSPAACRWAQALRAQLATFAHAPLPDVPVAPSPNGGPTGAAAPPLVAAPPSPPAPVGAPAPPAPPPPRERPASSAPRPSRLGGAILLALVAAIAVLVVVLVSGGGSDKATTTSASPATTPAQARTQPSTTPTGQIIGAANLLATPAGGSAIGLGVVQRAGGKLAIAIEATKLPANGAQDDYAAWLQGAPGTKLLGFVPRQVKANGTFTVTAAAPADVRRYDTVLITRESTTGGVPTQPGEAIMRGTLKFR